MAKETPIINIFTYGLPYELTHQIYNEFQERIRETLYLINNTDKYRMLKRNYKTVELLMALSIFYKRVIANLDAAVKFHGTVLRLSQADTIRIGNYELTTDEKNKILGLLMSYQKLLRRFNISEAIWNYSLTKEFLSKIIYLKEFGNVNDQEENSTNKKEGGQKNEVDEDEIPF